MKKQYHGSRFNGRCIVVVEIIDDDGTITRTYPLCHFNRHSPSGFEWGYSGSGPADLARAIMIDYLAYADDPAGLMPLDRVQVLADEYYMAFKFEVVSGLPRDEWRMSANLVEQWKASYEERVKVTIK